MLVLGFGFKNKKNEVHSKLQSYNLYEVEIYVCPKKKHGCGWRVRVILKKPGNQVELGERA